MKLEIKFWENIILSNKKIEPMNDEQEADYKIAEYLLFRQKEKAAA